MSWVKDGRGGLASQPFWIAGKLLWQYFDGHVAAEFRVMRLINFAHTARADLRTDFVGT